MLTALIIGGLPSRLKALIRCFIWDDYDEVIYKKKLKIFTEANLKDFKIGDAIVEIGRSFLGTEYVGGTLDKDIEEKLVINLQGLDCVTFVENCITFARCLQKSKTTFENFKTELEYIRYRNGYIDGYASRLHYFTDWIYDNENKGVVKDITYDLGGIKYSKTINFMSTHPKSYKQLSDKSNLSSIIAVEHDINSRIYYFIPTKNISKVYEQLQNGDIVATTTSISGLDVTHTGYVIKGDDGGTYFLHASLKSKQVIISSTQLEDYITEDSKKTGIMVARPQEIT
jgi:hypothetical protein